jgi:ankyrin repeat protein
MKHLLLTTIAAVLLVGTAFADPIHDAANIGDIGDVQAELDAGVDVNAKDNLGTFRYAASGGHKEIVELLIAEGADVNVKDNNGWTPLHTATKEIAELLIAKGVDVNAKDDFGRTPLDFAKPYPKTADLLRKHGGKTGEELKAEGN